MFSFRIKLVPVYRSTLFEIFLSHLYIYPLFPHFKQNNKLTNTNITGFLYSLKNENCHRTCCCCLTANALQCTQSVDGVFVQTQTCDTDVNNCYASHLESSGVTTVTQSCDETVGGEKNAFSAFVPTGASCCQMPITDQLIAISADNFDGVTVTANWFSVNCTNPVRCGAASTTVSVVAAITASVVAIKNLF